MDGFARRKEHSKEDIRKAAWELFGQFGVEKVSMVDIAKKAGVSQATIYNNFGSKEALAREYLTHAIDQLLERVREVLSPEKSYWEKMADLVRFPASMLAQGKISPADAPVFTSSRDLIQDPEIQKIHDAAQEKMVGILLELVQEGKAQGQIRPDLSDEAFRMYFRAFMNIFTDSRFRHYDERDAQIVADLGTLMISGMNGQVK